MDGSEFVERGAEAYTVSLPTFEGPLDLLLHLCQKHELDILDVPISFITEKYLEYLDLMRLLNLDVAAEYLVMAATLAHIKSKMLLPTPPADQEDDTLLEEVDPRQALIRRLLEYQKYKHAGETLASRDVAGRDVFARGATLEEAVTSGPAPLKEIPIFALLDAFQRVLDRAKVKLTHDVVADRISITDRINELTDVLVQKKRLRFEELFSGIRTRFELVITFLALLEMTRLRMTSLQQDEPLSPLYIECNLTEASAKAYAEEGGAAALDLDFEFAGTEKAIDREARSDEASPNEASPNEASPGEASPGEASPGEALATETPFEALRESEPLDAAPVDSDAAAEEPRVQPHPRERAAELGADSFDGAGTDTGPAQDTLDRIERTSYVAPRASGSETDSAAEHTPDTDPERIT